MTRGASIVVLAALLAVSTACATPMTSEAPPSSSDAGRTASTATTRVDPAGPAIGRLLAAHPYYVASVIPGSMYDGNPHDAPTFGTRVLLVTSARESEDRVYALVKAIFENFADFRRLHPTLSTLTPSDLVPGAEVTPIHPGAAKYYRDAGLSRALAPTTTRGM